MENSLDLVMVWALQGRLNAQDIFWPRPAMPTNSRHKCMHRHGRAWNKFVPAIPRQPFLRLLFGDPKQSPGGVADNLREHRALLLKARP